MKIAILCSSEDHPVNAYLARWIRDHQASHEIQLARRKADLRGGDLLFLVSCVEIVSAEDRARFGKVLVIHASDLPRGRGWSPHVWQIAAGQEDICLSLLEAEDKIDSGMIWRKLGVRVPKHALVDEINELIFQGELALMSHAVESLATASPVEQDAAIEPTYYRKRTPEDSRVDPTKSLESQFDLIRVCDPERYPAFFELRGHRYKIRLEKADG